MYGMAKGVVWVCFIHNIELFATYINTKDNVLADHLSRLPYKGLVTKCELTCSQLVCLLFTVSALQSLLNAQLGLAGTEWRLRRGGRAGPRRGGIRSFCKHF